MDKLDRNLVRMCIGGDAAAFDALMRRHRETVFLFAYAITHDHANAEDLTEEIFIEAFRSLPTLRDGDKFRAWLRVIAQRVVARWVEDRQKERERICSTSLDDLPEGVTVGWMPSAENLLLLNERRIAIRQAVHELSTCHRQVVALHYIKGLSCEAISRHLHVPLGTVKRRLHDARESLQREMTRMGIAPKVKQKMPKGKLQVTIWGECSSSRRHEHPFTLCRPLLTQRILVAIAKEAKKVEDVAEAVKADKAYILDELERLERNEIVTRDSASRYRANLFVLLRDGRAVLTDTARALGEKAAAIIADELPKVKEVVAHCSFAQKGFGWEQMQWIILPCYLANLGVRRCYPELFAVTPPLRPNGDRWYAYLIEETGEVKWEAGCNSSRTDNGGTAHFWTPQVKKKFTEHIGMNSIFVGLAQQPQTATALAKAAALPPKELRERLSHLAEFEYVVRRGQKFHLNFPIMFQDDMAKLEKETLRICRPIVEKVYKPAFADIDRLFDRLGYRHLKDQYSALKAFFGTETHGYTIGALVKRGILPQPPAVAPATWGFWSWLGRSELL